MNASGGFATLGRMAMVACAYCCRADTELKMLFVRVPDSRLQYGFRLVTALRAAVQADSRHGIL
jgi:hypothetical protein